MILEEKDKLEQREKSDTSNILFDISNIIFKVDIKEEALLEL